jgi:glucose-specific phosphotransferase system IIA component
MSTTPVLAAVAGRAVPLAEVPDPTFSQGMVGPGAAIDPPRGVVDAVAPVGGKVVRLYPHAYIIMTAEHVGVLVHLGLDTVQLKGEGFDLRVQEGDEVEVGQVVVTYDVLAVEATGRNPIVPVVVLDKQPEDIALADAVSAGAELAALEELFVVNH